MHISRKVFSNLLLLIGGLQESSAFAGGSDEEAPVEVSQVMIVYMCMRLLSGVVSAWVNAEELSSSRLFTSSAWLLRDFAAVRSL